MLEVSDLFVSYGAITALSGISFTVADGAIVTLIGGNGAGKTTPLRTLSGLLRAPERPDSVPGREYRHRCRPIGSWPAGFATFRKAG